ncbi:MAG TPA: hypothetical protein VFG54_15745 [Prolixibacteraceae bacterium]|nr:hypothetical protein [Prolixibacteraceae bacterium]
MKRIVSLFILIIVLFSCKVEIEDVVQPKPGNFILTELKSPTLKSAPIDSVKTQFSLGDIKASKEYFFILSNGGDEPIYDVEFISDNPAFKIFPEKISELPGAGKSNTMIPLLSLNVIHGMQLNGIGYTDLLPMNLNSATITVTGKTTENGTVVDVSSAFSFNVNARIMDIVLYKDSKEVDLYKPSAFVSSNLGGLGFVRLFNISSGKTTLKNNGNVDISVVAFTQDPVNYQMVKGEASPLLKGNSLELTPQNGLTIFELNSDGTITNDERIQLGNNGKGYFGIYVTQTTPGNVNPVDSLKTN